MDRFDVDRLDEDWPFEIDHQADNLFKHSRPGVDDIDDVWAMIRCSIPPNRPPTG